MMLDIDTVVKVLSFTLSAAAMLFAYIATRRKDVDARFKEGSERMDRHDTRISSLEHHLKEMPDKDDVHALQLELARMSGAIGEIRVMMDGNSKIMARLENIVSRHEDHLLEGSKK